MFNFYFLDLPKCKLNQKIYYGVAKHETAKIECQVDADPSDVIFSWRFNNTNSQNVDIISFASQGMKSLASYIPKVDMDYGMLLCWAQNRVGKQQEPCTFFIIEAGITLFK